MNAKASVAGVPTYQLSSASEDISPFLVSFPLPVLDDLRARLANTRWPDAELVSDSSQGVQLAKIKELAAYWRDIYVPTRLEQRLNAFPQFRTSIFGLGVHFIHVRSKHEHALPIVLTHGWPGSVIEFLNVIELLTDPEAHGGTAEDAFHVVVPSLPGYGFSDKPQAVGWNTSRIANAWAVLMQRLGYDNWVAQGGDWGAAITTALAHLKPAGLVGIHLNLAFVFPKHTPPDLAPEEQRAENQLTWFKQNEFGYFLEQATRPQTISYGLADSPIAQAAWIYEKFHSWSDNSGDVEEAINRDELLDNISLYWLTGTAASSARMYWENHPVSFSSGRIEFPVAISVFPKEIYQAPKSWAMQTFPGLMYWNELSGGGHFAALEQPNVFAQELRGAFRGVR